ncbi:uncharacterized protein [Lolium perenne]|uniref:uncharacterized protein n=1 Tax=Lolium perenne TaxID=4522 RepID=UPI003A9A3915
MDWSNLGEGPAGMIAERLLADDVTDYVRFHAVCRPWRQCTADPRAHGMLDRRFLPRRWIMLREETADPDRRRLLNVSTGQCVRAHLPELRGHDVCAPTVEGLLVLLNRTTYAVRLLNPLTRQVADLPPATTLYSLYWRAGMYDADPRLDFKVSAAGLADDAVTVAVLFEEVQTLAIAKPGDKQWTLVEQGISFSPAISFGGRFYCITDSDINIHTIKLRSGEVDNFNGEGRYFMHYNVSRVDFDARNTRTVCDLGGHAVFIGSTRAISVSPLAFPAITNDSVYIGKDHPMGNHLESTGPYKLVDGCGFHNYGPHGIVCYLSQYVTTEDDTSDSDDEANCVTCSERV